MTVVDSKVTQPLPISEVQDLNTLFLTVHRGSNLMKTDLVGKSDPYVVIQYGDKKYKSKTINNNQNPTWNFDVELPVQERNKDIIISVYDEDIGKDDPMGNTTLKIEDLIIDKTVSNRSITLKDCKSGEIFISSTHKSNAVATAESIPVEKDIKMESIDPNAVATDKSIPVEKNIKMERIDPKDKDSSKLESSKESNVEIKETSVVKEVESKDAKEAISGNNKNITEIITVVDSKVTQPLPISEVQDLNTLFLTVHRGSNLMKTDLVGKSDPYVVIQYGDKKYKSKTVKNNQNPTWNFDVELQ